jgi:hypothetical protein
VVRYPPGNTKLGWEPRLKEETQTTGQELIRKKFSLPEPAEYLKNVSEACRVMGMCRQHFHDIRKAYDEQGMEGLKEKGNIMVSGLAIDFRKSGAMSDGVSHQSPFWIDEQEDW